MHVLTLLVAIGYAAVTTFGAWTLVRRRRWLAFAHLGVAGALMVGGVATVYRLASGAYWLAAAALGASVVSFLSAKIVARRVILANHVSRGVVGVLLTALAFLATLP